LVLRAILSHDNTGKLSPGSIGPSNLQRQWIGLSLTGDLATVESLPPPPHPSAPSFLEAIDIEVGFLRRGFEIAEQFSSDEMTRNFIKAFNGIVMSSDQVIVFEFHGHNLKGTIKSVSTLELADEQRGSARGGQHPASRQNMGILMDKTAVSFLKAPDSKIKIKSSSKKLVSRSTFDVFLLTISFKGSAERNPCSQFQI
jgi:vesicle-fusing ATPase